MSLETFTSELAENRDILSYSEDEIKHSVILPLLQLLGWNIFRVTEVKPEHSLGSKRVDYSLRIGERNTVFVEVKRPSVSLDQFQEQLLNYAFHEGVRLTVLTNGVNWWFYLPLREGSWEQRKFFSINIFDQDPKETAKRFDDFIGKENIVSGQAQRKAEQILIGKSRSKEVANTLPKAWKALISEPDELLLELLKDKMEDLCGYTPVPDELIPFLENLSQDSPVPRKPESRPESATLSRHRQIKPSPSPTPQEGVVGRDHLVHEIVKALQGLGGRAPKGRVEYLVFEEFRSEFLKEWYQEPVAHGVPRWKHNVAWAKEKAKHEGLIKPPSESGRGMWELTKLGKELEKK